MKPMVHITVITLLATAVACASSNPDQDGSPVKATERVAADVHVALDLTHEWPLKETTFQTTRTALWNAVVATHERLGLPVQSSDNEHGVIIYWAPRLGRSFMNKPLSYYFDCGNGPGGQPRVDTYQVSLKVIEMMDSVAGGGMRLRTGTQASARTEGSASDALHCGSNMKLETLIAGMVSTRLQP